jgi:hypothetical protein
MQAAAWWIIGVAWFLLLGCIVTDHGTPFRRGLSTGILFTVERTGLSRFEKGVLNVNYD